jgi:ribosomal protein S27E
MEIAHLINISIFWSFIIILVSVFGTAIFLSVLALIRKNRVDKAISKIIPNKKYYFWEVESKAVRDYIEFDVTFVKIGEGSERFFVKLKCPNCYSENVTFIEFIKGSVHHVCNSCHEIFLNELK